jgi:hypothetical protein
MIERLIDFERQKVWVLSVSITARTTSVVSWFVFVLVPQLTLVSTQLKPVDFEHRFIDVLI